jgi:membrane fusion protein (multidrug efflux system)
MQSEAEIQAPASKGVMRYLIAVLGVLLLAAGLAGVKGKQISTLIGMGKQFEKSGPPPEAVSTSVAQSQSWEGTLSAIGSVTTRRGVAISNDAPGVVLAIRFESGAVVRQGQVLVELDSRVERAQLASARARNELADTSAKRTRALVATNAIPTSQLDNDESALKGAAADVGALEAQIERKIVRAPFAGKLGIRQVNIGQYLNPGTTITELESSDSNFVDFTLPQQELESLSLGTKVRVSVTDDDASAPLEGVIAALEPDVDQTTRTIKARASLPNAPDAPRPGTFVNVSVLLPQKADVVAIPATGVVHASFGDSVFIVEDAKDASGNVVTGPDGKPVNAVRQQFVRLGQARGDFIAITNGVKAGQEVVTAGAFKLRNGGHVTIDNSSVKLNPQLSPHPENR